MIYGGLFDLDNKLKRIEELEAKTLEENFWNLSNSSEIIEELNSLKEESNLLKSFKEKIETCNELIDLVSEEDIIELDQIYQKLKIQVLLSGEYDKNNAYIEIHSGAGGTESNDWADMIFRMYTKYFDSKNYKYEIISIQTGDEVGIKGAVIYLKARNAFGLLKSETGVHRLVRISPFDSNSRRHTSFASVLITPEVDKSINLEIKEEHLKIDVYRSGGAGGQSVNTTDSAVRITHIPTGIVVTCQNERSQIQNKEKAMQILKGKLYIIEQEKINEKLKNLKGNIMDVNFGSQIRSYVMHPYNMVKDHRTEVETSNVKKVMDGDIDLFIEAELKL